MGRKPNNEQKITKGKDNESDTDVIDVEDVTQEVDYSGLTDLNECSYSSSNENSETESEDKDTSQNRRTTPSKMKQILNQIEESDDDSDDLEESKTNNNENQIEEIEEIGEEVNVSEDGNATSNGSDKKHMNMLTPKKGDGTQVNSAKTSAPKRKQN